MKNIDIKSLIIGVLLTSTIFLGVAATSKDDAGKWDKNQEWLITVGDPTDRNSGFASLEASYKRASEGAEPFGVSGKNVIFRKRIK